MNWYLISGLIIFLLGILFFFFLATRKKYRDPSAAPNYEKIREKLTLRELQPKKVKKQRDSNFVGGFLSNIIAGFVVVLIGTSLLGPISQEINGVCDGSKMVNITQTNPICSSGSATNTILKMVPGFFAFGILALALTHVFRTLKGVGMI